MEFENRMKSALEIQKAQIYELERALIEFERSDLAAANKANELLIKKQQAELNKAAEEISSLKRINTGLRSSLYDYLFSEKIAILNDRRKFMNLYFKEEENRAENSIQMLEQYFIRKLTSFTSSLGELEMPEKHELERQISEMTVKINAAFKQMYERRQNAFNDIREESKTRFEELSHIPINDDQIIRRTRSVNTEMRFGSRVANIAGIVLILLGVVFGLQYTYVNFLKSPEIRCISAYILGILVLAAGEFMDRRSRTAFSIGMTSLGIAVLHTSTAVSYFGMNVIGMYPALFISIAVTALSFILSMRYNSMTVAIFAFVGGYLPMASLADQANSSFIYGAMIYFLILNALTLLIARTKGWRVINAVSFGLNTLGTVVILSLSAFMYSDSEVSLAARTVYIALNIIMYNIVVLIGPIQKKSELTLSDYVILALNTVIGSCLVFAVFSRYPDYNGTIAFCFFAIYYTFGLYLDRVLDRNVSGLLYYITAVSFAVLVIPLQLGSDWLMLGWLCEGVLLFSVGELCGWRRDSREDQRHGEFPWRRYTTSGIIISALCGMAYLNDTATVLAYGDLADYPFRFTMLMVGFISMLAVRYYIRRNDHVWWESRQGFGTRLFMYYLFVHFYIYLLYITSKGLSSVSYQFHDAWFGYAAMIITFGYSYALKRFKLIKSNFFKVFSSVLMVIGLFGTISLNSAAYSSEAANPVVFAVVLIIVNAVSVFMLYDFCRSYAETHKNWLEAVPLVVSLYALIIIETDMLKQFNLPMTSMIVSFILMGAAFLWIFFGFARRYKFMRLCGLGLAFISVFKLFLVDLAFLAEGQRILSYFVFGAVLIGISYLYQRFARRLDGITKKDLG